MRLLLAGAVSLLLAAAHAASVPAAGNATYVGSARCATCHADAMAQWRTSDHAKSMQVATAETVLGHFDGSTTRQGGAPVTFSVKDGAYLAHAIGEDGQARDYPVRHTFGFYPLQQYLVELSGGRLQALGAAWDSRAAEQGGQRWYDLNPELKLAPGDPLHWTGRDQNWNFMCADCHSTGVRRNYDLKARRYDTTWREINVSCEACHGPGSRHVAWAGGARDPGEADKGLLVSLHAGRDLNWTFSRPEQFIAAPSGPIAAARHEVDACFPCHARRQPLSDTPTPGKPFLDNYLPSLIERNLYFPDGQIKDEVFEFGSFTQSAMYRAGVTCSNCHAPHTLKLRATGNTLCAQCHQADHYDRVEHYHHPIGSSGAQCVNCHMPHKTYMGVDVRRDHSLRIPRPDLSVRLGTPNACTQCHADHSAQWAADTVAGWRGGKPPRDHFAPAIDAAWLDSPAADRLLGALMARGDAPGIIRGSAASQLRDPAALTRAARDEDPIVRLGAARGLEALPPDQAARAGAALLADPLRAVRVEAARSLTGVSLDARAATHFKKAQGELFAMEQAAADRPESHLNLARLHARLGQFAQAEKELRLALSLDPRFVPALVNLADLYRETGRDALGESLLQKAVRYAPDHPEALHALGLLKVRQGRREEALALLARSVRVGGAEPRYAYVYGVALAETGAGDKALAVIDQALRQSPQNASLLQARIALERQLGRQADAARHQREFQRLAEGQ
ncbi:MAG: tetratricopeptide repeat protein [Proteobacteria bacterium]|nr:tetratricopeptide repeat protein [Pseudomonadota bacterium]HQR04559.1 tetratricopeptide repeat protein [Rhodocyclaceae bacterium]